MIRTVWLALVFLIAVGALAALKAGIATPAKQQAELSYNVIGRAAEALSKADRLDVSFVDVSDNKTVQTTTTGVLEIGALAKRRLAEEYAAAQERGEIAKRADGPALRDHVPGENEIATAADVVLSRKEIHEAKTTTDEAVSKRPAKISKIVSRHWHEGYTKLTKRSAIDRHATRKPPS